MTYEEAVKYILEHAGPHGLSHECLHEFFDSVDAWLNRREATNSNEKPDYSRWASEALWEWDI